MGGDETFTSVAVWTDVDGKIQERAKKKQQQRGVVLLVVEPMRNDGQT